MTNYYLEWDTTPSETQGGGWSVSNDGYTLTVSSGGEVNGVSNNPISANSYYCEVTIQQYAGSGNLALGIANAIYQSGGYMLGVLVINNGTIYYASTTSGGYQSTGYSLGTLNTGDVIGIAVSLPNLVWLNRNGGNWNGNSSANPATGVGGISLANITMPVSPAVVLPDGINGADGILVINAGQTAFQYTPPSLFNAWPGPETIILNAIATVDAGNPIALSGSTYNGEAAALDYSLDEGSTWQTISTYSGGATWTAVGPAYPGYALGRIEVRDHFNILSVSNEQTFSVTGNPVEGVPIRFVNPNWDFESSSSATAWNQSDSTINLGFYDDGMTDGYDYASAGTNYVTASGGTIVLTGVNSFGFGLGYLFQEKLSQAYAVFNIGAGGANPDGIGCYQLVLADNEHSTFTGPGGTGTFTTQSTGGFGFQFLQDTETGALTASVSYNGTEVLVLGPAVDSGFGNWSTQGIFISFQSPPLSYQDRNNNGPPMVAFGFNAYDTSQGAETLTITGASASVGLCSLTGTNSGNVVEVMDYRLDNGVDYAGNPVWNTLPNYSPGINWSGAFPISTPGTHTVQVRDDAFQTITSNIETFVVSLGIFVWNGVTLP